MRHFAIGCIVVVILLTLIAAFSVKDGAIAAAIGGGGFVCLLIALCFYALADIRALIQTR